jgi:hypothetical protein
MMCLSNGHLFDISVVPPFQNSWILDIMSQYNSVAACNKKYMKMTSQHQNFYLDICLLYINCCVDENKIFFSKWYSIFCVFYMFFLTFPNFPAKGWSLHKFFKGLSLYQT